MLFTVGGGCISWASLRAAADEAQLSDAYEVFAQAARYLDSDYVPEDLSCVFFVKALEAVHGKR